MRVIDGDTVEVKPLIGVTITCRLDWLDCDEMGTSRGVKQKAILQGFFNNVIMPPYIILKYRRGKIGKKLEVCGRGRAIARVYVWRWFRYVDYAKWMKSKGHVKKGSKWND